MRQAISTGRPAPAEREISGSIGKIIGISKPIHQVIETIRQVAPTDISVMIYGASGTGKELVAEAIHEESTHRNGPLIIVNCGAIPEGILESELFGHEKGAFTGALTSRKGYFEMADGGTIFLDEIGDMPLGTQVKVLRVLEGREFMRVGGSEPRRVDVRVIAATNKNLEREVAEGSFREDLYFRLNAVQVHVPPLRDRPEDVPLLADHFAREVCRKNKISFAGFDDEARDLLQQYDWPGNVRELKNVVERIIVLERGERIDGERLLRHLQVRIPGRESANLPVALKMTPDQAEREFIYRALWELKAEISQLRELLLHNFGAGQPIPVLPHSTQMELPHPENDHSEAAVEHLTELSIDEIERLLIQKRLEYFGGNKRKAANSLKISERTLYRKIKEYGLPF